MPDLKFDIEGAEPLISAGDSVIALKLRISSARSDETVHSIRLRYQIHIEATRRRYTADEQSKLFDLFGLPAEWGRTLRNFPWASSEFNVPAFAEETLADLPVPCASELNGAPEKYFAALENGDVPLYLLFSGTVFHATANGPPQIARIPHDTQATFRLPISVWHMAMQASAEYSGAR